MIRAFAAFAGLFALHALSAAPSFGVQIFIDSAFVHRRNNQCIVQITPSGVPQFRCPPFPDEVCAAAVAAPVCSPSSGTPCCPATCTSCGAGGTTALPAETGLSINPREASFGWGNISNEPHIEFATEAAATACSANPGGGVIDTNICNAALFMCASIGYGNTDSGTSSTDIAIDEMSFEIFKFVDGANPLDEGTTPPVRTFFIDSPGVLEGGGCTSVPDPANGCPGPLGPFCVLWDGSINIQGEFGKTNGQFGFRAKTKTNQTGASGNIQITAVRAYPSGATRDANNDIVSQKAIVVDVVDVHVVRSSPTMIGSISPVPAHPYTLSYRLSKDATTFIEIESPENGQTLRSVLPGLPRVGENMPPAGLTANADSWNGRADNGAILPPGVYMARVGAEARDQYGFDVAVDVLKQIALDPLQITDIRVQPLLEGATNLALLDYQLTEPATVYIDIYPPGTQFCRLSGENVNDVTRVPDDTNPNNPPKQFYPTYGGNCSGAMPPAQSVSPVKRIVEQKPGRSRVTSFWDGRDQSGNVLSDGDYVYVIYAALPSQNGFPFGGVSADRRIWTSQVKSGFIPIIRGFVGISQIAPSSTVIGSSPSVAGINPFIFRYSLSRDALVTMKIFDSNGVNVVKTLIKNEIRPGLFPNAERWDEGYDENGLVISSGAYLVQLTAADPQFPAKVSTTTAMFSINMFRIADVSVSPLLSGASDIILINYQLSQTMFVGINIYPPGTIFKNVLDQWPPCGSITPSNCSQIVDANNTPVQPVNSIRGLRVGRLRITDQWDGRDPNGLLVPDGLYPYTITAESTTTPKRFPTDRVIGNIAVQRGQIIFTQFEIEPEIAQLFASSGAGSISLHPYQINYQLTRQSSVTLQVLNTFNPPSLVRTIFAGEVREANLPITDLWDGLDDRGNFPPAGFYNIRALATDIAAQSSNLSVSTAQLTIIYNPLRIYDVAASPIRIDSPAARIVYQVSEPMKVAIKIYKPGTSFDTQGNPSPPDSVSLVKRIVEIKDPRHQVESIWDGTDLRLALVPDGTYKYKIVGSTDITAINTLTGDVITPSALATDREIQDLPVLRNGTDIPDADFVQNTFVYPNPATGANVNFQIFQPVQGRTKLRIHNIAGDLVYSQDFPERPSSFAQAIPPFNWPKTNQAGRGVARGIYYAVIRFEGSLGDSIVYQTVKKVLIP